MARRVRDRFVEWHNHCVSNGERIPILIVTVASAPDLTVASALPHPSVGIIRWYVRSQEESQLIALYLRWKHDVQQAAVFWEHDWYGAHGKDEFRDRFISPSLAGRCLGDFPVTADNAKSKVTEFLRKLAAHPESTGVLVVGYGNTLSKTVAELIAQKFSGLIACTSTLTGPEWQPISKDADRRIATVLPRLKNPQNVLAGQDRDVVYFFAKSTLYRVIKLTAEDSNTETFLERWRKGAHTSHLIEEYLADGDTIIQLDVVDRPEYWR
jgi:ABC-type branched-subunit amino acid transport system substrate-binding protein